MFRKMLVLATVVLLGTAAAFTQGQLPRAGAQPAGTDITPLRTPEARHFSNGDGTVTAVLTARDPNLPRAFDVATLSTGYECYTESIYGLINQISKTPGALYTGFTDWMGYAWTVERCHAEWDVSSIPDGSTVNSVRCSTYCNSSGYGMPTIVRLYDMTVRPTPGGALALFQDAANGRQYDSFVPQAGQWRAKNLNGDTLLQNHIANGKWFALGFSCPKSGSNEVQFTNTRLIVNYTPPVVHDVACVNVFVPVGVYDSGVTVTPACSVYNYGTASENFNVRFQIPTLSYNQTATVSGLAPSTGVRVTATPVALNRPRTSKFAIRCSTELTGDGVSNNNRRVDSAWTRVIDAQPVAILYPGANTDSGVAVTPSVRVRNNGTQNATFDIHFWTDGGFSSVRTMTNLAPGAQDIADFDQWTPTQRGSNALHCATLLAGDLVRSNDTIHGSTTVIVHDAQPVAILAPGASTDSGVATTPSVRVRNNGNQAATFDVHFWTDDGYSSTRTITGLAAGAQDTADFDAWAPTQRGSNALHCATLLASDMVRSNDTISGATFVNVGDVQPVAILAPGANSDSAVATTPSVTVRNNGNGAATFDVHFWTDGGYSSTRTITSLAAGAQDTADFDAWTPAQRGSNALHCATLLSGDQVRANDTIGGSTFVRVLDARPVSIDVPAANIDSSGPITPRVTVENRGNVAATFDVQMAIGGWSGSATVANLGAGATVPADMTTQWQPTRGSHAITVTTLLTGDMVPANDVLTGSVDVAVHDVGVVSIIAPASPLTEGDLVTPRVAVSNYGTDAATTDVRLVIKDNAGTEVYSHDLTGVVVPPSGIADLPFSPDWTAGAAGSYTTQAFTMLAGDMHSENDTAGNAFVVDPAGTHDVAVAAITVPSGTIDAGATVVPRAWVANRGTLAATFDAWFHIILEDGEVYASSAPVSGLAPGESTEVAFDGWDGPHLVGDYVSRCSVYVVGDVNPANDTLSRGFTVAWRPDWAAGWHSVEHMPTGSGKQVKDGGWLSFHAANGLVYAAKGNKQRDFFAYNPIGDTWTAKPDVPLGDNSKLPGKGATGCSDGAGFLYATKGNNTLEFYKFSTAVDSWYQLEAIPAGANRIKGGTDMAYVDRGDSQYVYLLKGYKNEFYRYNTSSGHWEPLANAPSGASMKYDKGSWLVHDGGNQLYVHQAKYHKLYTYDIANAAWSTTALTGMPMHSGITGRNKKSKDGGCAAWSNNGIYALKGGNTQEYWRYFPTGDSWTEYDTMPQWTAYTGRKKKVKAGSDLTSFMNGILFALKGNKTLECWRWVDYPTMLGATPSRDGVVASGRLAIDDCQLSIAPNPMSGSRVLHLTTGALGRSATIAIYDALGRLVLARPLGHSTTSLLDVRNLSAGVYVVKLSSDGYTTSQKLVIER